MILFIKVFHLFSLFALIALSGFALAVCFAVSFDPGKGAALKAARKRILFWAGLASLAVFLSGFALLGMLKHGMPAWAVVKLLCWIVVSAVGGMVFRFPEKWRMFSGIGGAAAMLALLMVFFKPGL